MPRILRSREFYMGLIAVLVLLWAWRKFGASLMSGGKGGGPAAGGRRRR